MRKTKYGYLFVLVILISLWLIISSIYKVIYNKYQVNNLIEKFEVNSVERDRKKHIQHSDNQKLKENDLVGLLIYDKYNIKIPVIEGTNEVNLEKGAGHLIDSGMPPSHEECFLFGHRDTVFSCLKNVQKSLVYFLKRNHTIDKL